MEQSKSTYNGHSFLKSSILAGGGLMISFTWLPDTALADKTKDLGRALQRQMLLQAAAATCDG